MDYLVLYVLFHCSLPNSGNLKYDLETPAQCRIIVATDNIDAAIKATADTGDYVVGFKISKDEARAYQEYFPDDAKYGKELEELEEKIK